MVVDPPGDGVSMGFFGDLFVGTTWLLTGPQAREGWGVALLTA